MTAPKDGTYWLSPAFLIVASGTLQGVGSPSLTYTTSGSYVSKPSYTVQAALDGGFVFASTPQTATLPLLSNQPRAISIAWDPVPYARTYRVYRTFTDALGVTRIHVIYQGSGERVYSGKPGVGSQWWPMRDRYIWDHVTDDWVADGSKAPGALISSIPSASAYRGWWTIKDLRHINETGTRPDVDVICNAIDRDDFTDPTVENANERLVALERGIRGSLPLTFQFTWAGKGEKTLIDIFNASMAAPDDDPPSLPGLLLYVSTNYNAALSDQEHLFDPSIYWRLCRLAPGSKFPVRPNAGDAIVRGELQWTFEFTDPAYTLPYPLTWDTGQPILL